MRFFRNLKLKKKIALIASLSALIVGLVSVFGYQYSLKQYSELLYQQTSNTLSSFTWELSKELDGITQLSQRADVSLTFQNNLFTWISGGQPGKAASRAVIIKELYPYLSEYIKCITVIPDNGATIFLGDTVPELPKTIEKATRLAEERDGGDAWLSTGRDDGTILCARKIRRSSYEGYLDSMGYLLFRVDLQRIVNSFSLRESTAFKEYILTVSCENKQVFAYNTESVLQDLPALGDYLIQEIDGQKHFMVSDTLSLPNGPWTVTRGVSYDKTFHSIRFANLLGSVLLVLSILAAIATSFALAGSLAQQCNHLMVKMNRLKAGDFSILPEKQEPPNDELGILNRYFDTMTVEFKRMIDDNYVKQLLITQAQLQALEQQLNPHFLYNTLETVRWLAKRSGEPDIPVIVEALAGFLRGNLAEHADVIPLTTELKLVQDYVQILKIRFPDLLRVSFEIEEPAVHVLVPKMSLQPLVENAIRYTMAEEVEECRVTVRVRVLGEEFECSVEDNGPPIDPDILDKLRKKTVLPKGNGIGLLNVDARIKLLFGERYGLSFENKPGSMMVSYRLPRNPEEHRRQ